MADNRNKMIYGKDIVGKRIQDKSAVALEYTLHDKAPKVIASGKGYLAEKIVETAADSGVPIYEDNSLATILSQLQLGQEIPESFCGMPAMLLPVSFM